MPEVLRVGVAGLGEAATEFLPACSTSPLIKVASAAERREIMLSAQVPTRD